MAICSGHGVPLADAAAPTCGDTDGASTPQACTGGLVYDSSKSAATSPADSPTCCTARCLDADVRTVDGAGLPALASTAATPEVFFNGQWYPICGNWFWDNDNGAATLCKKLGFTSGAKTLTRAAYSKDAMPVGFCGPTEPLNACTGGGNAWGNFDNANGQCRKGNEMSITVTCAGGAQQRTVSCVAVPTCGDTDLAGTQQTCSGGLLFDGSKSAATSPADSPTCCTAPPSTTTATSTLTSTMTSTLTSSRSATPITSATRSATSTASSTATTTASGTATTLTTTATSSASRTATTTATSSMSATDSSTISSTDSSTVSSTGTTTISSSATSTQTTSATSTRTSSQSSTRTSTGTASASSSLTTSASSTVSSTATTTVSSTATSSATSSPTASVSSSASATVTTTDTSSQSSSASTSFTTTATTSPSSTATSTDSSTATTTVSGTATSATTTATTSISSTATTTPSSTATTSQSSSVTSTMSSSVTSTDSSSVTSTATSSASTTVSSSATSSATTSASTSESTTASSSISSTATSTVTYTVVAPKPCAPPSGGRCRVHNSTGAPPYTALATQFAFACEHFVAVEHKTKLAGNAFNAGGLKFTYEWSLPGTGRNTIHDSLVAVSDPVDLPQGSAVRVDFTITDTRSDCDQFRTHTTIAVGQPDLKQTTVMMKQDSLDKLAEGDIEKGLQTLGVLTLAVLSDQTPRAAATNTTGNASATGDTGAAGPPEAAPAKTAEDEEKEMEQRDKLVSVVQSILANNVENITAAQADLIVSTMTLVSGGDKPAVMTTETCEKATDTLLLLSSTGKVSADKTDAFASTFVNIVSNVNGDTSPEAADKEVADVSVQKDVIAKLSEAVENVLFGILPPADADSSSAASTAPVKATAPDNSFQAVAQRAPCAGVVLTNSNVSFSVPRSWVCPDEEAGAGGTLMSSLAFGASPYRWANGSAAGAIGGLRLVSQARHGKVAIKNRECGNISVAYTDQVQYSQAHTIGRGSPLTLSFERTQADLGKALHFIVEPYHSAAHKEAGPAVVVEAVDVFLRTTPELLALDINGINGSIFNHSFTPRSVRGPPPGVARRGEASSSAVPQAIGHAGHVLHLVPAHQINESCADSASRTSTTFNTSTATYTLVVRTNSSADVRVHVRIFHAECVFYEPAPASKQRRASKEAAAWGGAGCATLPTSTPELLQCSCNHLTSFGGRWRSAPVAPNMVEVRLIDENDILDNPVVFIPIVTIWFFFCLLLLYSARAERAAAAIPDLPCRIDRGDELEGIPKAKLNDYRLVLKTGTRPFAGLAKGNEVVVELRDEKGREDTLTISADESAYMARNTKSTWLFSTPMDLERIHELSLRVSGADSSWYVNYVIISDTENAQEAFQFLDDRHMDPFEMDRRSKFFWVNGWANIYTETTAEAVPFEEFNASNNLFGYHLMASLTDKHFVASIFLSPPKSRFTAPQRVGVCLLLLNGIIFANAFFFQGDESVSWERATFIGALSSVIVTPVVGCVVLVFRRFGRGDRYRDRVGQVLGWLVTLGASGWCSYYVLLLSFAWGPEKSKTWLASCGTAFVISTMVVDIVYVFVFAAIYARMHKIHDVATVEEVALQNLAGKLAGAGKGDAAAAAGGKGATAEDGSGDSRGASDSDSEDSRPGAGDSRPNGRRPSDRSSSGSLSDSSDGSSRSSFAGSTSSTRSKRQLTSIRQRSQQQQSLRARSRRGPPSGTDTRSSAASWPERPRSHAGRPERTRPPPSERVHSASAASAAAGRPADLRGADEQAAWSQPNAGFEQHAGFQQWDTIVGALGQHAGQGQWAGAGPHVHTAMPGAGHHGGYFDPQTQPVDWSAQGASGWTQQTQQTHYHPQHDWTAVQQDEYLAIGGGGRPRSQF